MYYPNPSASKLNPPRTRTERASRCVRGGQRSQGTSLASDVPRVQGLCSSAKCPRHQVLQLPERDEHPIGTPAVDEPELAQHAAGVVEVGVRHAQVAIGNAPAAVILRDRGVVALGLPLLDEGGERTGVAVEAALLEVGADLVGLHVALRLPGHDLEPLAATRDGGAADATVEVPLGVVGVEVREIAVRLRERGEIHRVDVRHFNHVAGIADGRSPEGVAAGRRVVRRGLGEPRVPAVDDGLDDLVHRVASLGGHEPVERLDRHLLALARLEELITERPHETETLLEETIVLVRHRRLCSIALAYPSSRALMRRIPDLPS